MFNWMIKKIVRYTCSILKERMEYESKKGLAPIPQAARPEQETMAYFKKGHKRA